MVDDNTNVGQLIEQISVKKPDLVEFRLDKVHEPRLLGEIARRKSFPAIATDKSNRGSPANLEILSHAAVAGFELVDIVLSDDSNSALKQLKAKGAEVIVSYHDSSTTPSILELDRVLAAEREAGADICKVVTTARRPHDNLTVLGFVEDGASKTRLVSFAMGSQGVPSRILSPLFGAEFTFASLTPESRTADGQLSIDELRDAWQILGIR